MFGIRLQNTFLDLYSNAVMTFEMNSPLYFGDDIDVLQGSFMFTINAPLTPKNARLLRRPNVLDNALSFMENEPAAVYTNGTDILRGSLSVTAASSKEVSLKIHIASDAQLIETLVSDWFKTDEVIIPTPINVSDYMFDTCLFPLRYPFVFHPVQNETFESDTTDLPVGVKWQNAIKVVQQMVNGDPQELATFGMPLTPRTALTPFFRLEYVLKEIFKRAGFALDNRFQVPNELKLLTLYNNRTLLNWTSDTEYTLQNAIQFKNHLPTIQTGPWLKKIVRLFNQGLFIDRFNNQATIQSAESVLDNDYVSADWTGKVLKDYTLSESKNRIGKYDFEENSDNLTPFKYSTLDTDSEKEYKAAYMSLPSEIGVPPVRSPLAADISVPGIIQEGSKIYFDATKNVDFSPRLMLFRGLADSIMEGDGVSVQDRYALGYPLTACEDADALGNEVKIGWNSVLSIPDTPDFPVATAQNTLHWVGEKGIYARYWAKWNDFLKLRRSLKMQLLLTPKDVQQFRFQHKVRIGNRIYLVKKLRFSITRKGLQPVEAELVSVI